MIVPFWPTQPCTAVTPIIRVGVPRTLPQQLIMLKMPRKEHELWPLIKMFLIACRLSGNPLNREFLRGLGTSSYNFGDMELLNSIHLTLQSLLHFVVANKLIVSPHFIPSITFSS